MMTGILLVDIILIGIIVYWVATIIGNLSHMFWG
jgi:hypothetical protein